MTQNPIIHNQLLNYVDENEQRNNVNNVSNDNEIENKNINQNENENKNDNDNDNDNNNCNNVDSPFDYPNSPNDKKWQWREMLQNNFLKNDHSDHIKKIISNNIMYKNVKLQNQIKKSSILKFGCPLHDLKPCLMKCNYKVPDYALCNGYSHHCNEHLFKNNKEIHQKMFKVAEYSFINLNVQNETQSLLKTVLNAQIIIYKEKKLHSLITIPIHVLRTNETTFEKRFRPGLYNFDPNNNQNKDKNKIGTWLNGKLFYVRLNDIVLLPLIEKYLYLQVALHSDECNKKRDGLYDIVGGIGFCQLQKHRFDGVHNCIVLRSNDSNILNVLSRSKICVFQFRDNNNDNGNFFHNEYGNCQVNIFFNNQSLQLSIMKPIQSVFDLYAKNPHYNCDANINNDNTNNMIDNTNNLIDSTNNMIDNTNNMIDNTNNSANNETNYNMITQQNNANTILPVQTPILPSPFSSIQMQSMQHFQQHSQQLSSILTTTSIPMLLPTSMPTLPTPQFFFEKNYNILGNIDLQNSNETNETTIHHACVNTNNCLDHMDYNAYNYYNCDKNNNDNCINRNSLNNLSCCKDQDWKNDNDYHNNVSCNQNCDVVYNNQNIVASNIDHVVNSLAPFKRRKLDNNSNISVSNASNNNDNNYNYDVSGNKPLGSILNPNSYNDIHYNNNRNNKSL